MNIHVMLLLLSFVEPSHVSEVVVTAPSTWCPVDVREPMDSRDASSYQEIGVIEYTEVKYHEKE